MQCIAILCSEIRDTAGEGKVREGEPTFPRVPG